MTEKIQRDEELGSFSKHTAHGRPLVPTTFGIPTVLFSGMCYCVASGSMVLLNKHALNPKVRASASGGLGGMWALAPPWDGLPPPWP